MEVVASYSDSKLKQKSISITCDSDDDMADLVIREILVGSGEITQEENLLCLASELNALICLLNASLLLLPCGLKQQGTVLSTITPFFDELGDDLPSIRVGSYYDQLVRIELYYDDSDFYTADSFLGIFIDLSDSECRLLINYLSETTKILLENEAK